MIRKIMEMSGKKTGMIGTNGVYIGDEHFPTVNTTPESYTLHQYFAKMAEEGCGCCVMEVSSRHLRCTGWMESSLTIPFLPTFPRIISGRMSMRILKNICIIRNRFSARADTAW